MIPIVLQAIDLHVKRSCKNPEQNDDSHILIVFKRSGVVS